MQGATLMSTPQKPQVKRQKPLRTIQHMLPVCLMWRRVEGRREGISGQRM